MENTQSKGMSKGCLIGLIVGGVIIVIIAIGLMAFWIYKDDVAKVGGTVLVNGIKADLATHEYESVDTVQFNAIADAFLEAQEQDTLFDLGAYALFMQSLQGIMADQEFGEDEVPVVVDAFIEFYPELEELRPGDSREELSFGEWLDAAVSLHERLQEARLAFLRDASNSENAKEWNGFGVRFNSDMQAYQELLQRVQPLDARMKIVVVFEGIRNMFHTTAFQKSQEYQEASTAYANDVQELEAYIAEISTADEK